MMAVPIFTLKFRDILKPNSSEKFVRKSLWLFSVSNTELQGWRVTAKDVGRLMWTLPAQKPRARGCTPGFDCKILSWPSNCTYSSKESHVS